MTLSPSLLREALDLVAQASVIAEAPGVDFVPSGDRAYESSGTSGPSGGRFTTHDEFKRLVQRCVTDDMLRDAIASMRATLKSLQTPAPPLTTKEIERRILTECSPKPPPMPGRLGEPGKDAHDVARWFGVTVEFVCDVRRRNGRRPVDGGVVKGAPLPAAASDDERRERVRILHRDEPDLSWRQIAVRLGIGHTQVLRDAKTLGLRTDRKAA